MEQESCTDISSGRIWDAYCFLGQNLKRRINDLERQGASTTSISGSSTPGSSATLLPQTTPGQSRVVSNHIVPVPNPMLNNRGVPETSGFMQQQHMPPDWIQEMSMSSMLEDCDPPYEDFFSFTSSSSLNPAVDMSMSLEQKRIDQPGNSERIQLLSNLSECMQQNTQGAEDTEEATPSISSEELQMSGSCHSSSISSSEVCDSSNTKTKPRRLTPNAGNTI